jgi:hypothetical protein
LNSTYLYAKQPINADSPGGGVASELDKLLNGEDADQVLDAAAVLCMSSFQLNVRCRITGYPSDVGHTDHVAVQDGIEHTCAAERPILKRIRSRVS